MTETGKCRIPGQYDRVHITGAHRPQRDDQGRTAGSSRSDGEAATEAGSCKRKSFAGIRSLKKYVSCSSNHRPALRKRAVAQVNRIYSIHLCDNPIISPIQSKIKIKQVTICSHNIYVFLLIISRVKMSTPK